MTSLWRAHADPPVGTPFEPDAHHDVIVVGAGITGLSTAVMLARRGLDVAVVESGRVAELATGGNTGKLSVLQGSVLSTLRRHHPAKLVRAYVDSNRAGMGWLTDFATAAGVPFTHRTAFSYAQGGDGVDTVAAEAHAAAEAGLPVRRTTPDDLPFPVVDAVALDDQVAIDPAAVASALAMALLAAGGTLHTGVRVTRVHVLPAPTVTTAAGSMGADHVVVATGAPIMDRGLYWAKTHGVRSYCVAFRLAGDLPQALAISVDDPTRSIRSITPGDGPAADAQLVVGGNGHPVGRGGPTTPRVAELVAWTRRFFPGAEPVADWSAQDYVSDDLIPFVGAMPRGLGRARFATGYGKWGLSNGPAAGIRLTAEITGTRWSQRPDWMRTIATRMTVPADIATGAAEGVQVGLAAVTGWADAESRPVPVARPAEGEGVVAQRAGVPVGVSTVDGVTRGIRAVCTHLGGVLTWNDAECTWDCPLHASRFAADGTRLEGPAVRDLERLG